MSRNIIAPIAAGVLLAMAGAAQAATKTNSFNVTASVAKNCIIDAGNLNFGAFDGATDIDATSTITVNCTRNTAFNVGLSQGVYGDFAGRRMRNLVNNEELVYNLYTTTVRDVVWEETTNRVAGLGDGMNSDQLLTVFGRLRGSDNTGALEAGDFTDTIIATVEY
jgi:spore coat protein U-like protein